MVLGAMIGAFQGTIIAYARVPSFIVTLGGLLVWRGVAWAIASGRTIAPMDTTFQLLGGGSRGTIGGPASWVLAVLACVAIVGGVILGRRRRIKFGFSLRPQWADTLIAVAGSAAVLASVAVLNRYYLPENLARAYAEENGIAWPEGGLQIPLGIANPVIIAIVLAIIMTFVATRRRFGRYVFAIGGNPEAAELGGIKTRWTIVKTFMLMGVLVAIAAAVQTARLNAAVSGLGQLAELYVIAAAVIGGTSLAGGVGHHLRGGAGGAGHAVAPIRDGADGCRRPVAGHRGRHRPRSGGGRRHHLPPSGPVKVGEKVTEATPLVEMRDIQVSFGGVHAVDRVSVDLYPGEVVALVGGNGAGKTTLIKTLSGAHPADAGQILINGEPVAIHNPRDAKLYGIETIYQTLALADNIDAPANMFLGRELRTKWGSLDDAPWRMPPAR
jgi:ribose/xylose/arabinose/galactoside ABC-type transport system permease subunit